MVLSSQQALYDIMHPSPQTQQFLPPFPNGHHPTSLHHSGHNYLMTPSPLQLTQSLPMTMPVALMILVDVAMLGL
jgi:hypothetical protein